MTPVKQELVLGCFALAIAAAFIFGNRYHCTPQDKVSIKHGPPYRS